MIKAVPIVLLAATSLLGSCKHRQHLTRANIRVVEAEFAKAQAMQSAAGKEGGLSVKEVESVLGPPHRVDPPETALRDVELFRYYYEQDKEMFELHFFNSRLIAINHEATASPDPKP